MSNYVPINANVYTLASGCAMAGMVAANRSNISTLSSNYDRYSALSKSYGQAFDMRWNSAAPIDELQASMIIEATEGYWGGGQRAPLLLVAANLSPSTWFPVIDPIIAQIASIESAFAAEGIVPPPWGGGSSGIPTPPGPAGLVLTTTGGTDPSDIDWDVPGGFSITSFSGGSTVEIGSTVTNPTVHATYSEAPDSASVAYPAGGSPLVLTAPFLTGTVLAAFTSNAIGATKSLVLTAIKGAITRSLTSNILFAATVAYGPSNAPAATQGFVDGLYAANHQLKLGNAGTYEATMGAGEFFCWAAPAAFAQPPVVLFGVLPIIPTLVGAVPGGWNNSFGVNVPTNVWTFGVAGTGDTIYSVTG